VVIARDVCWELFIPVIQQNRGKHESLLRARETRLDDSARQRPPATELQFSLVSVFFRRQFYGDQHNLAT
jgi:hypothetical protein